MKHFYCALLMLLSFSGHGQVDALLRKAFTSNDSSAYFFKKAKQSIRTEKDQAEYYFCKNAWHSDRVNIDSTEYYGDKAERLFIKHKSWVKLMYVYNNIGKAYNSVGEYAKAIAQFQKGLKVAEREKDDFWTGNFYEAISIAYHDFEDYRQGVRYGKKALSVFEKSKKTNHFDIAGALNAIAINFDDWNKPDSALAYHYKVFDYVKGKDTVYLSSAYNNIGNTLLKQKKYREARRWVEIAAILSAKNEVGRAIQDVWYDLATNYTNLGIIAFNLGESAKAEKYFALALDNATKSNNVEKMRDYYYAQYLYNKHRGDLAKAIHFQDEYIALRDSVFNTDRAGKLAALEAKYQNELKENELLQSRAALAENEVLIRKKNSQFVILSLIVVALVIIIWLVYRQQRLRQRQLTQEHELKTAIAKVETQNILQQQRLEISRDLHDNIGAQLTFIISSVDNIKYAFDLTNTKLDEKLQNISDFAKDTIVELRDTIWAMNHREITLDDLRIRILNFIEKAKEAKSDVTFEFNMPANRESHRFSPLVGVNMYRTIQEAVHNALKYSNATKISIEVSEYEKGFGLSNITVSDNGSGFDLAKVQRGNGLSNMEKRMDDIGARLKIDSKPGGGTKIQIDLADRFGVRQKGEITNQ